MINMTNSKKTIILTETTIIPARTLISILEEYIKRYKNPMVKLEEMTFGYDSLTALIIEDQENG